MINPKIWIRIAYFAILTLSCSVWGGEVTRNDLYKKYEPADPRPALREGVSWNRFISYIPEKSNKPKILLIGDSICGGMGNWCSVPVQTQFGDTAHVAYWVSSRLCVDPDFIRALNVALEQYDYDIISFNIGFHYKNGKSQEKFSATYENAVNFIQAKCPKAKLLLTTSTFLRAFGTNPKWRLIGPEKISEAQFKSIPDIKNNRHATYNYYLDRKINSVVFKLAEERNLPIVDLWKTAALFPRTDEYWRDAAHFSDKGFKILGEELVRRIRETANLPKYQGKPITYKESRSVVNYMFNTQDHEHARVFAVGANLFNEDMLRLTELKEVANIGTTIMHMGYEVPSYMDTLDYMASLLPYDLVLYNPPIGEFNDDWKRNFSKAFSILRKRSPDAKIALVTLPGKAEEINAFLREFAAHNKAFVIETQTTKARFEEHMLGKAAKRLLNIAEPTEKIIPAESKLGPKGAIK